eukprot:COSAG01_NODE_19123_length_1029_cov_1.266667_2_plen_83_part_01
MGDGGARAILAAIVHEFEARERKTELGEMMGKAKASVKAQVRLKTELASLAGSHQVEAAAAAEPAPAAALQVHLPPPVHKHGY